MPIMNEAHCSAVMILGEPFAQPGLFDFSSQDVTKRIHQLIPTMLKYRSVSSSKPHDRNPHEMSVHFLPQLDPTTDGDLFSAPQTVWSIFVVCEAPG